MKSVLNLHVADHHMHPIPLTPSCKSTEDRIIDVATRLPTPHVCGPADAGANSGPRIRWATECRAVRGHALYQSIVLGG